MVHLLLGVIYLSFISLGLPDGLLGAGWPAMHLEFDVPMSWAGMVSMLICVGTITSSLNCEKITRHLGAGKMTMVSVATTAIAIFGFSTSHSFWQLCLWAIPYGLGAGSVDAVLNNYVAIHYSSKHMSWLHCMWGVGASTGPFVMGYALTSGQVWNAGYRYVALMQITLTILLMLSLPVWKQHEAKKTQMEDGEKVQEPSSLTLAQTLAIPGAKAAALMFFLYCTVEQTAALWSASFLTMSRGVSPEAAAAFASRFFLGLTVGRGLSGFVTMKFNDAQMVRLGQGMILVGIVVLFLPLGQTTALIGLALIGFGCAPIFPCCIHATPERFGTEYSQKIIGLQMASAYVGVLLMPPLFGLLGTAFGMQILPIYLLVGLVLMFCTHEKLAKIS